MSSVVQELANRVIAKALRREITRNARLIVHDQIASAVEREARQLEPAQVVRTLQFRTVDAVHIPMRLTWNVPI